MFTKFNRAIDYPRRLYNSVVIWLIRLIIKFWYDQIVLTGCSSMSMIGQFSASVCWLYHTFEFFKKRINNCCFWRKLCICDTYNDDISLWTRNKCGAILFKIWNQAFSTTKTCSIIFLSQTCAWLNSSSFFLGWPPLRKRSTNITHYEMVPLNHE